MEKDNNTQCMREIILHSLEKLKNTGFFHIFGSTVINKILAFLSNFIVVRIISKEAFGIYTYANNILSFLLLVSGLGLVSGIFQLCSENYGNKEKSDSIYSFGSGIAFASNILLSLIILFVAFFVSLPVKGSNVLLMLMAVTPIINIIFDLQQIYLRSNLKNAEYSYATMINTGLLLVFSVGGAITYQAEGLVIARYIAYILSSFIIYKLFHAPIKIAIKRIDKETEKVLMNISIISMLNNGLSQLLYLVDIFVMGLVGLGETIIASYKVATIIPTALYFIPSAVCVYIYPHFAMNKNNKKWLLNNYYKLTIIMGVCNFIISAILIIIAPFIVTIFFGKQYVDAVVCFRILMVGYFFNGTFRGIVGNLLVTQRKLKFNFFIGLIAGIINIAGNIFLIPIMGSIGAAYTTLIVTIFSSIISSLYFIYVLRKIKS